MTNERHFCRKRFFGGVQSSPFQVLLVTSLTHLSGVQTFKNFWKIVSQLLLLTFSKYFSRQPQSDQYHVLAASRISSANSAARLYSGVCLKVMYLVKYSSCSWAFSPLVPLTENKQAESTELTVFIVAVPQIIRVILYQSQLGYFLVTAHHVHCNCFDQFHFHRCLTEKEYNL